VSRISQVFSLLSQRREKALVAFAVAGHPSREECEKILPGLAEGGADIIEIGIPFSDPIADGAANQAAYASALARGVTPMEVLAMARRFTAHHKTPVALMTYCNPVLQMGWKQFAREARQAGVEGVIIVDLPPEEAGEWKEAAQEFYLDTIFLIAPTSTPDRIKWVAQNSRGFIYCVSRMGVTGVRAQLPAGLAEMIQNIRSLTCQPLVAGFGISTPQQVREVCRLADGAVVGSAIVELVAEKKGDDDLADAAAGLVRRLKDAALLKGVAANGKGS
jgi:tryptophan synthase alpha chain